MNADNCDLLAITYVGSSKYGFYKNFSTEVNRLHASLKKYNICLKVYDSAELKKLVKFPDTNLFYFLTRYGAGAWFWKPLIISHSLKTNRAKILLYLDADCVVLKDPRLAIEEGLRDSDVNVFKQNVSLDCWISNRALKHLGLNVFDAHRITLLTAGIILVRNSKDSLSFMNTWADTMRNPKVLLHPIFAPARRKHRHDQAVLSALVGTGKLKCGVMNSGFYSLGDESLEWEIEHAWVGTGNLNSTSHTMGNLQRLNSITDYYFLFAYDVIKSILITPVHYFAYCAAKKTRQFRIENHG